MSRWRADPGGSGVAPLLELALDGLEFIAEDLQAHGVLLDGEFADEEVLALTERGFGRKGIAGHVPSQADPAPSRGGARHRGVT